MKNRSYYFRTLQFLLLIILGLGIFFRFANIEQKVYWYDETISSLRIIGYSKEELTQKVANNSVITVADLQKYQQIQPQRNLKDTIATLQENPEHPPLYYAIARLWTECFGSSIAVVRSLSALCSLLVFPCLYWLCWELFQSPQVGWIAIALVAVSPFHILYAQEARAYSLWTVIILLTSVLLLRAIGLQTKLNWSMYAITLAIGFYTHLFTIFVAFGHGIYLVITEGWRFTKTVKAYLLSFLGTVLLFSPWLVFILNDFESPGWSDKHLPLSTLIARWIVNFSSLFLDVQLGYNQQLFDVSAGRDALQLSINNPWLYLLIPIVALEAYALYCLCHRTPRQIWLLVISLIGAIALPLILPDLLGGGQKSTIGRYLIPCYLGVHIAIAHLIATHITPISTTKKQQWFWRTVFCLLISSSIISCTISSQTRTWWNKYSSYYNPQVVEILNQVNNPLIISSNTIRAVSLSYQLNEKTKFLLVKDPQKPDIPKNFENVFLFRPSEKLLSTLTRKYKVKPVYELGHLWSLE